MEALSNLVDIMVPTEISNLETGVSLTDILSDIDDAVYYSNGNTNLANMTTEEKTAFAESVLSLKRKHRENQERKAKTVLDFLVVKTFME